MTGENSAPIWLRGPVVAAVYLVLGLIVYAPVMKSFFLSDDFFYLNQIVHLDWPGVLLLQPGVFRPLHVVTWLVDYHFWGLNPLGYHLTNIVSHALTAFLVFVVARQLFGEVLSWPDASWAAGLAGLVFLVHPSHTEAVSWIIGRHDILAALFVLCAWYGYMHFRRRGRAGFGYLGLSLGAFFIALLFKESAISLPLVLAAYEGWLRLASKRPGRSWAWLGLYVVVLVVYLVLRRLAAGEVVSDFESPFVRPSLAVFVNLSATVFRSFLPYVPVQLLPSAPKLGLTGVTVAIAGLVVVGLAACWIVTSVRRPTPVRLLIGFLAVALVLSAIPTLAFGRPSIIDSESERYAYLPSIFASMIVGLAATVLVKTPVLRAAVAGVIVALLVMFLEVSNQNWRTAGELTSSILATVAAQGGSGELAVLVAPDDLNGAFVYRNGLPEALALFGPRPGPAVDVLAGAFLQRPDETITFTPVGPGSFAFGIPSARGSLVPSKTAVVPGVTLTPVDLYHMDVTLDRSLRVAYFSDGEMHIVDLTTS